MTGRKDRKRQREYIWKKKRNKKPKEEKSRQGKWGLFQEREVEHQERKGKNIKKKKKRKETQKAGPDKIGNSYLRVAGALQVGHVVLHRHGDLPTPRNMDGCIRPENEVDNTPSGEREVCYKRFVL